LKQLLEISFTDKLDSEATPPDDVEGLLYNFVPPDYSKSAFAFEQQVETDAKSFKPLGDKVGSYVRQAAAAASKSKGKGKAKAKSEVDAPVELSEDDENAVVFEMYKVRERSDRLPRLALTADDMGHARV
jgi:histone acetyltransferase 1